MLVVGASLAVLVAAILFWVVPRDRVLSWSAVAILAVATVFANNSVPRSLWVAAFAFSIVVAVLALLRAGSRRRPPAAFWLLAVIWLWIVVGALLAHSYSAQRLLIYAATSVSIGLLCARMSADDRRVVLRGLLWVMLLQTAIGVWDVFLGGGTPLWGYRGSLVPTNHLFSADVTRAQGTMGHPIVFGMFAGLGFILAWSNQIGLGWRARLLWLGVAATGLVISGTRSAIAAVAATVVFHLVLRPSIAVWIRNVVIGGTIAGIIAILNFGITERVNALIDSGSWVHRLASLTSVPTLVGRDPGEAWFGSGFGSEQSLFQDGYIKLTYGLEVVDNFWVYLLGTTGIVGVSIFLGCIIAAFVMADRQGRVMLAYVVAMGFSFDLFVWLFIGVLFGFLMPMSSRLETEPIGGRIPRRRRSVFGDTSRPSLALSKTHG